MIHGLLRTNDYETVAQCLSFMNVMAQQVVANQQQQVLIGKAMTEPKLYLEKVISPKLLTLTLGTITKTPQEPQIEFVHYGLELVSVCLQNKDLRTLVLDKPLPGMNEGTYVDFLKSLETHDQFRSIKRLAQKITRQRKELEMWAKSRQVEAVVAQKKEETAGV